LTLVRIGSRGSMLATWQAKHIAARLASLGVETEIIYIKTSGDKFQQAGINQIGVKGVFIKEIEDALLENRVDIAVHSMKDVPTETPAGLIFPAICEREDPRDCLISRDGKNFVALAAGARVGTGSLRRMAQLRHARPELTFTDLRGNVDTRLQKLKRGDYDAIVLAKAGMDRLSWSARISEVLSTDLSLPAVGQGALGLESRENLEPTIAAAIAKLDHAPTRLAVTAERALLRTLEGGCQVPLGAWARFENGHLVIDACVASTDGKDYIRKHGNSRASGVKEADLFGQQIARELIAAGAGRILQLAGRNVAS
jgi:hydroxymethylbilane synthase